MAVNTKKQTHRTARTYTLRKVVATATDDGPVYDFLNDAAGMVTGIGTQLYMLAEDLRWLPLRDDQFFRALRKAGEVAEKLQLAVVRLRDAAQQDEEIGL